MVTYSDIIKNQNEAEYLKKLHSTIVDYLEEVQRRVKNDEHLDIKQAVDIINHIINTPDLIEKFYQSTALSRVLSHNYNEKKYLTLHLVNVLSYALKIGTGLKYSREQLLELGLSALLYAVGLLKIPESIIGKKGKLTEAEVNVIKKHTEIGKNILFGFQAEYPLLSRVAHEYHEREDGSGYPEKLKGNKICECAKIIGLADAFDAMIHNRPYRKALAQYFSVKELIGSKNSMFCPKIIKAFLDEMGIFPIGSYVRLNNMGIGQVIATSKAYPLRPTIKLIFTSHAKRAPEETVINIEKHPVLYVTEAVSEEDLPREK
jgi:HD-GYP domain-containing protein (c-di-GMP phosphodiesterase class II)